MLSGSQSHTAEGPFMVINNSLFYNQLVRVFQMELIVHLAGSSMLLLVLSQKTNDTYGRREKGKGQPVFFFASNLSTI